MKRVTRCFDCNRLVRFYNTYKVRMDPPELKNGIMVEEVRLCKKCTHNAGYKVKGWKDLEAARTQKDN